MKYLRLAAVALLALLLTTSSLVPMRVLAVKPIPVWAAERTVRQLARYSEADTQRQEQRQERRPAAQPACRYDNAGSRLSEPVFVDGIPFGEIAGFSCTSAAEAIQGLENARAEMNAQIANYRAYMAECKARPIEQQGGCPWPKP